MTVHVYYGLKVDVRTMQCHVSGARRQRLATSESFEFGVVA